MKKKNGAHTKSAMSELLSRQNRNEVKDTEKSAPVHTRRGYIETLDAHVSANESGAATKTAAVSGRKRADAVECCGRPENVDGLQRTTACEHGSNAGYAGSRQPAAKSAAAASVSKVVCKTARIVRIAVVAAAVLVCLCTCIVSAVLLSDDTSVILRADTVVGAPSELKDETAALPEPVPASDTAEDDARMYRVDFTFYKKDTVSCCTAQRTVGELIDMLGIELDEGEKTRVDMSEVISGDTEINVDCVEYAFDTVSAAVEYETRYVDVQTIPRGTTQVHQQGAAGTKEIEYKLTYLNGVECEREQVGERIVTAPRERIVYRGSGGSVTVDGVTYNYSYYIDCRSTVYSGGGTCATGVPASENVIAVDPGVIPLGTRVYIEGVGMRTAADTGGSIKGNFIDIYYEPGNTRYIGYGIRNVRVYIF